MELPKTTQALVRLGYPPKGIGWMIGAIVKVLALYPDPELAASQLESTLPERGISRFGAPQFKRFLAQIHPESPFKEEVRSQKRLHHRRESAAKRREQREAIARLESLRSVELETLLLKPQAYDDLCGSHFRAVNTEGKRSLPFAHFISVPVGGQVK